MNDGFQTWSVGKSALSQVGEKCGGDKEQAEQ